MRTAYQERERLRQKAKYQRTREQVRANRLWTRYRIRMDEYEALIERQGGLCAICGTDEPKGKGEWHVDHDHLTGKVRGLLCTECNLGLGKFKDDPERLEKAAQYLKEQQWRE